jgi:hypothetical protein
MSTRVTPREELAEKFDAFKVSTMTVIVPTNVKYNLSALFETYPVLSTNFPETIKNNNGIAKSLHNQGVPFGAVTLIEYQHRRRGFKLKPNKICFRNNLCLVMYVGKMITIKIPIQGKIHMTGCVDDSHHMQCMQYLWEFTRKHPHIYEFTGTPVIRPRMMVTFHVVMTNIVFNVGFFVNRRRLDQYINSYTTLNSMFNPTFEYTGVNIKSAIEVDYTDCYVESLTGDLDGQWLSANIPLNVYREALPAREKRREDLRKYKNTFLVFHSGKAIMTGTSRKHMREGYIEFMTILHEAKPFVEDKLHTPKKRSLQNNLQNNL